MQVEDDPNVIYGGDPEESTAIDVNCPSLGYMILSDLKLGENKPSFVSFCCCFLLDVALFEGQFIKFLS